MRRRLRNRRRSSQRLQRIKVRVAAMTIMRMRMRIIRKMRLGFSYRLFKEHFPDLHFVPFFFLGRFVYKEFLNIEEDCEGPDLLHLESITLTSSPDHDESSSNDSSTTLQKQVFVAYVEENDFFYRIFSHSNLPKSVADLTTSFQSST